MTYTLLSVRELAFSHENVSESVLSTCSFDFHSGDVVGLLGENGQGKTTLLDLLAGRLRPTGGSINWDKGYFLPSGGGIYLEQKLGGILLPWCTFNEHLRIFVRSNLGAAVGDGMREVARLVEPYANRPCGRLSGGESQLAGLLLAFSLNWDVALLDEPFIGIDRKRLPQILRGLYQTLRQPNKSALIVSHRLNTILFLCNRTLVLGGSAGARIIDNPHQGDESLLSHVPGELVAKYHEMICHV